MQSKKILVVDDEAQMRTALFRALERTGYQVITAGTCAEAISFAQLDTGFDLALIDLRLPDGDGLELMSKINQQQPNCQVIILTGFATIELAVEATQKGAFHFISKPINLNELLSLVDKALKHQQLESENVQLKSLLHKKYRFDNIVGQSPEIHQVLKLIERVSDSDSTVLITGESGTGKELVAKAIHFNSPRMNEPFIPINCGAIPGDLLESELFGHIKGAFTGAISNRTGRFEMADGGTLFLDEIGDMSANLQVKLLRVLQDRCFEPVGSTKTTSVNVRVLAATNANLEKAVKEGRFREDLFYRLNVIPIHIPALRDRQSDIPFLFHHFIQQFNMSRKRNLKGITPEALEQLAKYSWPGNIRELENLVERMAILKGEGIISIEDLPGKYVAESQSTGMGIIQDIDWKLPDHGMDFNSAVDNFENALILRALQKTGWNRNQAAMLLKLNRTTLVEKIKKKGLTPPEIEV